MIYWKASKKQFDNNLFFVSYNKAVWSFFYENVKYRNYVNGKCYINFGKTSESVLNLLIYFRF